jgi:hypothetical protein
LKSEIQHSIKMFSKITVIVALMAASVIAAPGYGGPIGNPGPGSGSSTGSVAQDACGSSGIQSCCNVKNGQAAGVLPLSGIFASADCIPVGKYQFCSQAARQTRVTPLTT